MNRILLGLCALILSGLYLAGCKAKKTAAPDPHSADGLILRLKEQSQLLQEAIGRKDYKYIHDNSYYLTRLAQALLERLDEQEKQRLRQSLDELINLASQLDRA